MATLDRLRDIVKNARGAVPVLDPRLAGALPATAEAVARQPQEPADHARAALMLGGALVERSEGAVIIVDREYTADTLHGRTPIGDIVSTIQEGSDALQLMARAWPAFAHGASAGQARGADGASAGQAPGADGASAGQAQVSHVASAGQDHKPDGRRLLFLDLETTGLFGGAGTQAFLIGCAAIDGASIRVRQFLMPGFEHERAALSGLQAWAQSHGALCTYNGRTFDAPLIETRFMFHRVPCPLDGVPHLDMLHAARRLWRQRPLTMGTPDPDESSCSLAVLEKHIAGLHRVGDVPGYEIPSRFFNFVRTGDARPLEAVLEHNRLDLLSLAAVLARAIVLINRGPSAASTAQEAYGLARVFERGGSYDNAEASLLKTIDFAKRVGAEPEVHGEALRRLAWLRRRSRRPHDAAAAWQELAALPRCAASLRREAAEALAIHHEHRSKDLDVARQHALELLSDPESNTTRARHRLDRLERKLARRDDARLPLN